MKPQIQGLD